MDELLHIDEELFEIKNRSERFPFPAITVGDRCLYFNICAQDYLRKIKATHFKFYTSTTLVIIEPLTHKMINSFSMQTCEGRVGVLGVPAALREKKIKRGSYKLFKCDKGLVFKRYEPLEVEGE